MASVAQLLKYDKEVAAFDDVIREEDIKFPPRSVTLLLAANFCHLLFML